MPFFNERKITHFARRFKCVKTRYKSNAFKHVLNAAYFFLGKLKSLFRFKMQAQPAKM
jgi:phosphatidylserine decarboxylase